MRMGRDQGGERLLPGASDRSSGGSLEAPAPLLTHLHTLYTEYSERLPTFSNPLAKRISPPQVCQAGRPSDFCGCLNCNSMQVDILGMEMDSDCTGPTLLRNFQTYQTRFGTVPAAAPVNAPQRTVA